MASLMVAIDFFETFETFEAFECFDTFVLALFTDIASQSLVEFEVCKDLCVLFDCRDPAENCGPKQSGVPSPSFAVGSPKNARDVEVKILCGSGANSSTNKGGGEDTVLGCTDIFDVGGCGLEVDAICPTEMFCFHLQEKLLRAPGPLDNAPNQDCQRKCQKSNVLFH